MSFLLIAPPYGWVETEQECGMQPIGLDPVYNVLVIGAQLVKIELLVWCRRVPITSFLARQGSFGSFGAGLKRYFDPLMRPAANGAV